MDTIIVNKDELIKKLRENLEGHRAVFEKASEVYREKVIKHLEKHLAEAKEGRDFDRMAIYSMPVPEDHTADYEMAIEMLEMETRGEVELDKGDFRRYVRDEWEWQRSWLQNTVAYSMQAD